MPTAAATMVVKKYDGTTDITWSLLSKAAGDGGWCQYRQDIGNAAPFAGRPTFKVRALESKNGIRRIEVLFEYPYAYVDANTGQYVISPMRISNRNGVWTVPQGLPPAVMNEAGAQYSNLMGHAQTRAGLCDQTSWT